MPNSNSSTSLYSFTNTVKVSANNFTTLYNATPSNVDVASVSDRNFTTLYNKQSEINPTRPYGNANVEAFLNIGHDQGGNVVHNINADGTLTIPNVYVQNNLTVDVTNGGVVFPPPIQINIPGGGPNYFLITNGGGSLSWEPPIVQYGNAIPFINFNVVVNANNQTFSNTLLSAYTSNAEMNVMKNGVNIEPELYSISGNVLTVNIPLRAGDTIDVLSTQASNGGSPGGNVYAVQYNNGTNGFAGDEGNLRFSPESAFGSEYTLTAKNLSVIGNTVNRLNLSVLGNINAGSNLSLNGNLTVNGSANLGNLTSTGNIFLGDIVNVHINGGSANYILQTDGGGVLSWVNPSSASPTSLNATIANVHISGGLNGYVLQTDGTGNLTWTAQTGGGGGNGVPGGSNTQVQYNNAGNFAGSATFTYNSTTDVLTANHITATNNLDITNAGGIPTSGSNANDSIILHITGTYNTAIGRDSSSMWFSVPTGGNYTWYTNGTAGANLNSGVFYASETLLAPNIGSAYSNIIGNGYALFDIPSTAITGIVANANYANFAGNAIAVDAANISGIVASAEQANISNIANVALYMTGPNVSGPVNEALAANVVVDNNQPNITSVGTLANLTVSGFVNFSTSPNVTLPTVNSVFMAGGNLYDVLTTNGSGNLSWAPPSSAPGGTDKQIQFNYSGLLGGTPNLTYDTATSNLSGTFNTVTVDTSLINTGDVTIQRAFEKYTPNATGLAGTFNYDVINQSIINVTANATANATVNFRGNSTTTLDSMLSVNQTITLVLVSRVGATAYIVNGVQIDGTTVLPKYVNGNGPTVGTRLANSLQSYTYTILKSAANTFTVLGSLAEFQ